MTVAGFFSGVGGIELGFEQAGFKIVYANEIDKNASISYKTNFNHNLIVDDIYNVKSNHIPRTDIIVAGFPCQAFSIAGYQKGFEDKRGEVFFQLARIIRDKSPKAIFIENVKNLLAHDKGKTFRIIKETLESFRYHLIPLLLNACEYGNVPQNRERIYIIGFKNKVIADKFVPPEKIPLTKTIQDIVDFNKKVDGKYYYTKEKNKFYSELEKTITNPKTVYQWRRVYVRENKSQLCPTLTANMGTGGHNVPLVLTKYGIRKLTPKECFMLQGYPETYKLPQTLSDATLYKQAGNSVVVPVIKRLAIKIKRVLENGDN